MIYEAKLDYTIDLWGNDELATVKAWVDQNTPVNLIVDTGATQTIIKKAIIEQFVPEAQWGETLAAKGINGKLTAVTKVTIPFLKVGNCPPAKDFEVLAMQGEVADDPMVSGLLGIDFLFEQFNKVTIDKPNRNLILED